MNIGSIEVKKKIELSSLILFKSNGDKEGSSTRNILNRSSFFFIICS
jgi:hypothetical protein